MVNDCIHLELEERQNRVALVDLLFEKPVENAELLVDEVKKFILEETEQSKNLQFLSVEYRHFEKEGLFDDSGCRAHVYLEVDLEYGSHEKRSSWSTCCHSLYYSSFMSKTNDLGDEKVAEKLELWGGLDVIGEYNWAEQLSMVVPQRNEAYDESCRVFRNAKSAIKQLQRLGEYPGFVSMLKTYNQPKPPYRMTRSDVLEGIVMGWW